jgi:hypothetical protein
MNTRIVRDRTALLPDRSLPRGAAWRLPLEIGAAFSMTGKFVVATLTARYGERLTFQCDSDGSAITVTGQDILVLAEPDAVSEIAASTTTLADVATLGECSYGVLIYDAEGGTVLMAIQGNLTWTAPLGLLGGTSATATAPIEVSIGDATPTTVTVSGTGENGANAYVYIGYASDDLGTGYSATPSPGLDYVAFLATDTEIATPTAGDFTGLWMQTGGGGAGDLLAANNLSDLTNAGTARTNLGLGDAAVKNTGTTTGTLAAGDHTHAQLHDALTLAGTPDYITLSGQVLTRNQIDLTTDVTGVLPVANFATGTPTGSKFVRDDGTLQAIPGGGDALVASTLDQFADVTQTGGATLAISASTTLSGGTHSGTNTGDNAVNSLYSGLVTNATHTGDVTGADALTIANGAVTEAKCNSSINASLDLADSSIQPGNAALTDERVPTAAGLTSKFGTNKATIVDGDKIAILDSAATDAPKHSLFSLIKSTLKTYFDTLYAATLGADDNYVTDAEKTVIGNTSGTNTGDQDLSGYVLTTAIDTLAELNGIVTDATLIDTNDARLSDARTPTAHSHEGTAILSTGEVGGTKFLREDGDGTCSWQTVAGGGGGGLTEFTETLHTASPNNTVNAAELAVTGGTTNVDVVIAPKGTGAFILGPEPDGTATGGNKRGARAVDLQTSRNAATKVASGAGSIQCGTNNTTTQADGATFGNGNNNTGTQGAVTLGSDNTNSTKQGFCFGGINSLTAIEYSQIIGYSNSNSGNISGVWGQWCNNSANYSMTLGTYGSGTRPGTFVFAGGRFGGTGDAQFAMPILRAATSDATPTELLLEGSARFTIPASGIIAGTISLVGTRTDGSAVAHYVRQFCIKNVAGTTSEVYSPITIGTDNAAGTSIAITANDTNDALKIEATGIAAQNWRWQAIVFANDIKYTS